MALCNMIVNFDQLLIKILISKKKFDVKLLNLYIYTKKKEKLFHSDAYFKVQCIAQCKANKHLDALCTMKLLFKSKISHNFKSYRHVNKLQTNEFIWWFTKEVVFQPLSVDPMEWGNILKWSLQMHYNKQFARVPFPAHPDSNTQITVRTVRFWWMQLSLCYSWSNVEQKVETFFLLTLFVSLCIHLLF